MNVWVHSLGQIGMKKRPVRNRYGYDTLQLGQFLAVPTFVTDASIYAKQAEILAAKDGTICREGCPVIFHI